MSSMSGWPTNNMPLEAHQATIEDAPRVAEIETLAFRDDPLTQILFPGPFEESAKADRIKHLVKRLQDSSTKWMKVVDTESKETIAFSSWSIYKPGEPIPPREPRRFGAGCNIAACEEFWGAMYAMQEKHTPDGPHIFLRQLWTHPDHQRRGAGRLLMTWGLNIADELKLPAYLESTIYGHGLYQSCGFVDVDKSVFDAAKYGGTAVGDIWFMERPARP